ncbi:MAG: O-antigen ligase family protein [Candidatus Omnitrophota bacterium]
MNPQIFLLVFYLASIVILLKRKGHIIYLMCLTVPFYDNFEGLFVNLSLFSIKFTLKPFLFFELVLVSLVVLDIWREKRLGKRLSFLNKAAFLSMFLFSLLALIFTIREGIPTFVGFNVCLLAVLLLAVPYYCKKETIELRKLLFYLFAGCVISFIPMLFENIIPSILSCSPPINRGLKIYGMTFAMIASPAVYAYLMSRRVHVHILSGIFLFIIFIMTILTQSRASIFALFLSVFFCTIFISVKRANYGLNMTRISSIVLILGLAVFGAYALNNSVINEIDIVKVFKDDSVIIQKDPFMGSIDSTFFKKVWALLAHERTIAWQSTIKILKTDPLIGRGLVFMPTQVGTHNAYLGVFLSSGIIGLFFYIVGMLAVLMNLIFKIIKNDEYPKYQFFYFSLSTALLTYCVNGIFQTNFNEYLPWFFAAVSFLDSPITGKVD